MIPPLALTLTRSLSNAITYVAANAATPISASAEIRTSRRFASPSSS